MERIVAACVEFEGKLYKGKNHYEAFKTIKEDCIFSYLPKGFLTNKGRCLSRSEAHDVAVKAGQIKPKISGTLISEDLNLEGEDVRAPSSTI